MTFPLISITTATPFRFKMGDYGGPRIASLLEVWVNASTADVYYGDAPGLPVSALGGTTVIGKKYINFPRGQKMGLNFQPGMVFSSSVDASDDGNVIVGIEDDRLEFRTAFTVAFGSTDAMTLTPPPVTSTNGIPIPQGEGHVWTADKECDILSGGIDFVVAAGTATMRLRYR